MAAYNTLILSGLLYEANFQEWLPRMLASLKVRGVTIVRKEGNLGVPDYDTVGNTCRLSTEKIMDIILGQVGLSILARLCIPRSSNQSTDILLCHLESLARPFRLLDLPAELRDQVYSYHFDGLFPRSMWWRSIYTAHAMFRDRRYAAQTSSCSRTAHLVYGRPTYRISFHYNPSIHGAGAGVVRAIRRWMSTMPTQNTKLFRSVELRVGFLVRVEMRGAAYRYRSIRFDYSPTIGLSVRSAGLGKKPKVMLADHIAQLARPGEGGAAKGNFIFRALTSRPELWDATSPLMMSKK